MTKLNPLQAIALSVNLNKIALIRNSREGNNPDIVGYAKKCIAAGADGLTVHPRPDQRHIRPEDCYQLQALVNEYKARQPTLEFNIAGNPFAGFCAKSRSDFSDYPGFIDILAQCKADQATLVPDSDTQLTSDHGFDLSGDNTELINIIKTIQDIGSRVSLFMDPDIDQISKAKEIGADRIELYTGPYADAYLADNRSDITSKHFEAHCKAAEHAAAIGLGVNAGHDLNLDNLQQYRDLPNLLEVSIGHALTIDSLAMGLDSSIKAYCKLLHFL
jgi:pyridoxine 5-phosphate synthase